MSYINPVLVEFSEIDRKWVKVQPEVNSYSMMDMETVYVGDKFDMLVTDSRFWWPIFM